MFASVGSPAVDDLAIDGHLAVQPFVFARDPLVLIVPPGNPEGLKGIDDLANPDRTIALCSLDSACGQATDAALMKTGITASPDVVATDGAAVVQAVTTGRASAGLAYRTDVTASVELPRPRRRPRGRCARDRSEARGDDEPGRRGRLHRVPVLGGSEAGARDDRTGATGRVTGRRHQLKAICS